MSTDLARLEVEPTNPSSTKTPRPHSPGRRLSWPAVAFDFLPRLKAGDSYAVQGSYLHPFGGFRLHWVCDGKPSSYAPSTGV